MHGMKFSKKILPNGLRVITIPMDNPTVTALVLVEAGSKYESKKINGLSHFLEHMCFKGTVRRPSQSDISRALDELGAVYNAFTSFEYTGYYAKGKSNYFKEILDIVSDLYLNPTFPEEEIKKEKGVIFGEIDMYEDQPKDKVGDIFVELLYGDQPAGRKILGTKQSVGRLLRKDFIDYRNKHYVPEATTVVITGGIKEKESFAEVSKIFGSVKKGSKVGKVPAREKQSSPQVRIHQKKTDQTHLIVGVRTFSLFDKRNPTLSILSGVLGAGMSSRLHLKIRDELGLGYYVGCGADDFTDHGFFAASAGVKSSRAEEAIRAIIGEFKRLTKEKVGKRELDKVKESLSNRMWMGLESSSAVANFFGGQEVMRKPIETPEEVEKKIRMVTPEAIKKLAREIFKDKYLNLALVGSHKNITAFKKILMFR